MMTEREAVYTYLLKKSLERAKESYTTSIQSSSIHLMWAAIDLERAANAILNGDHIGEDHDEVQG